MLPDVLVPKMFGFNPSHRETLNALGPPRPIFPEHFVVVLADMTPVKERKKPELKATATATLWQ